jgi:hypothetical protein
VHAAERFSVSQFSVTAALGLAIETLASPPSGTLPRVEGRGKQLARFVFPLDLCSPENRHSHGCNWAHAARKDKLWAIMRAQCPAFTAPLNGRALVRQVRFSSVEPDMPSDGFKTAIDFLCVPRFPKKLGGRFKRGLGFLVDDAPKYVERVAWWERVPRGSGFGLLEIWSGDHPDT